MIGIDAKYDQLSERYRKQFTEQIKNLDARLIESNCTFGPNPTPTFLKPYFMSSDEQKKLGHIVKCLLSMLEKSLNTYYTNPELRPVFGLSKDMESLIHVDTGYKRNIVISRPDALISHGTYQFIEFNCDSPAGAGYTDIQHDLFKDNVVMSELSAQYRWAPKKRIKKLLEALLICYKEYGGKKSHPNIAIVDWDFVKTQPEFLITKKYFEDHGYPTVVADPRELKLKKGSLWAKNFKVDLIYRRVITGELLAKKRECAGLLNAYKKGKVCMVNPLRSVLAGNKAVLTIMTNPAYDHFFTKEEIEIRDKHIPWTRRVVDAKKFYGGKKVYLQHLIADNRKDLVLKPSVGYGGRDVKIGKETTVRNWQKTIERAIRGGEKWVVQQFVDIPKMTVPVLKGNQFYLRKKKFNINPYVFGGHYAGAVVRLSDESVINVSKNGGLIPVMNYRKK